MPVRPKMRSNSLLEAVCLTFYLSRVCSSRNITRGTSIKHRINIFLYLWFPEETISS